MVKRTKKYTDKAVQKSSETEKLMIILTHLAGIFFSFIPALVVYLLAENPVKHHVKSALNWQLSLLLYFGISCILVFLFIGIFFVWMLGVLNTIFSIIAAIKASQDQEFIYPLSIKFVKGRI